MNSDSAGIRTSVVVHTLLHIAMRQDTNRTFQLICIASEHVTVPQAVSYVHNYSRQLTKESSNKVERQISHFKKKHEPVQDLFPFLSNHLSFLKFANRPYNNLSKDGMRIPMYTHVQFCDLKGREQ